MSDLIDKWKLLAAIRGYAIGPGVQPCRATTHFNRLLDRVERGELDTKPKPEQEPRPSLTEKIRSLPREKGVVRQYNMTSVDGQLAYLLDITDILLGFRNTHFEKGHTRDKERISWLMEQVKYLLEKGNNEMSPKVCNTCKHYHISGFSSSCIGCVVTGLKNWEAR